MEALHRLADRLDAAAAELAAARPDEWDPGDTGGGAHAPGLPGELAAALQSQRTAALHARTREAAAAAARVAGLAADLRTAAAGYSGVDETAGRRTAGRAEP